MTDGKVLNLNDQEPHIQEEIEASEQKQFEEQLEKTMQKKFREMLKELSIGVVDIHAMRAIVRILGMREIFTDTRLVLIGIVFYFLSVDEENRCPSKALEKEYFSFKTPDSEAKIIEYINQLFIDKDEKEIEKAYKNLVKANVIFCMTSDRYEQVKKLSPDYCYTIKNMGQL